MSDVLHVETAAALSGVDPLAWDALAGDDNPFVEHAFLASLEEAGCVGRKAGWVPAHLLVWQGQGAGRKLVGAAPTYVKDNSHGEYIFDWAWANACQRAGIPYYPKVVIGVPFTPATGPRLLVHPEADAAEVMSALAEGARRLAEAAHASSVHWLFTLPHEAEALSERGYRHRLSSQYHWFDHGFGDFDGYLAAMTSKRRKEVRRERRQALEEGLDVAVEPAGTLSPRDLDRLYRCYRSTVDARWGSAYLSRAWFQLLGERLGHRAHVVTARRDGELIAASLAFLKGHHLYGRYWGALEDVRALHFELCYYRLIEFALAEGVTRYEAGAQGSHKIARGFLPTLTHSAHWIGHPGLDAAVAGFLQQEAEHVRAEVATLMTHGPYRTPQSEEGA